MKNAEKYIIAKNKKFIKCYINYNIITVYFFCQFSVLFKK